ncbi:hypothetical protein SCUCBS95973_001164 [Sporothrix curviconia]|uniref:Arylsulfotransferase n=1 Tax=Sporothrix curviconia TaxID=1260050 RepID=A0ABP0AWE3_9PEZI
MRVFRNIALPLITGLGLARSEVTSTNYDEYNAGTLGHRPYQKFRSVDEFGPMLQITTWNRTATIGSSAVTNRNGGSHIFMRHDGHDEALETRAHRVGRPGIPTGQHRKLNPHSSMSSPVILDANDLSVVYVNRSFHNVFGARIQEDRGTRYFTFWAGNNIGGFGDGFGLVYDNTYRLVYNVTADNPNHVDLHEFALTGHGTALVAAVEWLPINSLLSNWTSLDDHRHLSGARLLDSRFQEIDLATNKVLFDWRATEHIDPADSMERRSNAWDPYHLNSIQKTSAGHYLVSLRHLHSIMLIDGQTGDIIWTIGGKRNMFSELPAPDGSLATTRPLLPNEFRWQHHAHYVPGTNETEMTFFDNYAKQTSHGLCTKDCSRAVHMAIDTSPKSGPPTVQLLGEYIHPAHIQAQSQGSVQILRSDTAGDNIFVGWGHCPGFTEHDAVTGEAVLDVQFSPWPTGLIRDALDNYRAYKMDWVATPYWDPALVLEESAVAAADKEAGFASSKAAAAPKDRAEKTMTAYVSWNGATEVKSWTFRASTTDTRNGGTVLATSSRTGFETGLQYKSSQTAGYRYVWAEALDKDGKVLRKSAVVDLGESVAVGGIYLTKTQVIAGVGVGAVSVVAAVVVAGVYVWRRRTGYRRLQAADNDEVKGGEAIEFDAERDTGVDMPSEEAVHVIGSDSEDGGESDDDDDGKDTNTDDESETGEEAPLRK